MQGNCQAPAPLRLSTGGNGRPLCMVAFIVIICVIAWWLWPRRRCELGASNESRPFNEPLGQLPSDHGPLVSTCQNTTAPKPTVTELASVGGPTVPTSMASDLGASLTANTYSMSQETRDYYDHFQPVALESSMPQGWRTGITEENCDPAFSEFSRYAISPKQMKKAEDMRSVLRLSEMSRDGLSRTLGQRSLLRDFVTPLGPQPVGNQAMLWNDSSVRQNYIAAATGKFPVVPENC